MATLAGAGVAALGECILMPVKVPNTRKSASTQVYFDRRLLDLVVAGDLDGARLRSHVRSDELDLLSTAGPWMGH